MKNSFSINNSIQNSVASVPNQKGNSKNKNIPEDYLKVANSMEKEFAKMMVNEMKKSIGKTEEVSSAEDFYQDLLTDEQSKVLTSGNGLGVSDLILNQIYPKHLRSEQNFLQYQALKAQQGGKHE